ncbi:MAG: site-2 protease family protein, partial [Myxococcota bacterium]
PPVFAFTRGETTYQVAAVPLGGFVSMVGEHPGEPISEEDRARSFTGAPIHQRALIALAGPAANLVFPVVCFFAYNLLEPEVIAPVVGQVEPGEAADQAGLLPGDRILSIDGERTWSFDRVVQLISARPEQRVALQIARDDDILVLEVTPKAVGTRDEFGKPTEKGMISVSSALDGTAIGVDNPSRLPPGFDQLRTGDRIVAVADEPVRRGDALGRTLTRHAGRTLELRVLREDPATAGDLVAAARPRVHRFEVEVPSDARKLSDLGLALGSTFVRAVVPGGAADRAGFRPGDRVLALDGVEVHHFWRFLTDISDKTRGAGEEGSPTVTVDVRRKGDVLRLVLAPDLVRCKHPTKEGLAKERDAGFGEGARPEAGVACALLARTHTNWGRTLSPELEPARLSIDEALVESVRLTGQIISLLVTHLFKMVVTREVSTDGLGGPLVFFSVAAEAARAGLFTYLQMLAFISINLGVFNLLPLPVLDGGHLLFCLVEAVKKKPLSPEAREKAALVGLALLALLLLFALRNDFRTLEIF